MQTVILRLLRMPARKDTGVDFGHFFDSTFEIKLVESKKYPKSNPVSFLAGIRSRRRIIVCMVSQKT